MNARETLEAARQSKLWLDGLMQRRSWWQQMEQAHSGDSPALAQLQRELDERIDEAVGQELEAMRRIDSLDDPRQREVLRYRYLNGWAWKEIARQMNFSQDWVKHVHARALKAMKM